MFVFVEMAIHILKVTSDTYSGICGIKSIITLGCGDTISSSAHFFKSPI